MLLRRSMFRGSSRIAAKAAAALAFLCATFAPAAMAAATDGDSLPPSTVLRQLERLAPQRAGAIDVYAIVVGGDGSEDVFEREVRAVERKLAERFGASARIVTLVNNRRLPEPEATRNAINYVVQWVSQRMDRNEDLLFLHLTSHGSADHRLVLSHPREPLYWLGKRDLRRILELSGIRHRFIVISACYSGGFIPELGNESTVVVTAAGSTVESYGCGNASEITDFSRAFYMRALGGARSLRDAVRMVAQYIHEDETRLGRKHSYPQASVGLRMDEYLRKVEPARGR